MRRLVVALITVVSIALGAMVAQSYQAEGTRKQVKGPGIEVTPENYDFGRVQQNQKLEKEFEILNIGTEELTIGRISTSCGCTAALTSDKFVKPGESTTLKVTLETRMYKGAIERTVSVASNAANSKITQIKVKAFVVESTEESAGE
ncbi:MAG TPA: DUF1573 domain-containing protein [Vicinamibacteria bacterium]|jgi:hypothetical protein